MAEDKHEGCVRGFVVLSESWYSESYATNDIVDEISVGMYYPNDGTTGEFCIRWRRIAGNSVPRLEVYDDAWDALHRFGDMLAWMASQDGQNVSPQAFADALRSMGVEDLTRRKRRVTTPAEREYASWFPLAV